MANAENIDKVINMIKEEQNFFNMCVWWNPEKNTKYPSNICGTPACIGGWSEAIMKHEQGFSGGYSIPDDEVAEWLGISEEEGDELFYTEYSNVKLGDIDRQTAIKHLTDIKNGGEVNWSNYFDSRYDEHYENDEEE